MPAYDADEIRALIAGGEVVGFTLDTNIIDGLNANGNLDNRILLSIENLKTKKITIVLSDVVANEVLAHMAKAHQGAHEELATALKTYSKIWKDYAAIAGDLAAKLPPREAIKDHSAALLKTFCEKVGISIISSAEAIGVAELMERYFTNQPPFAGADKKHEFPDAVALAGVDKWSRDHGYLLCVSRDKGWISYCEESEYLYCATDLGKALALFHEDEAIVAKCLTDLAEEPEGALAQEIANAIQRDLDDLDFQVEASAYMEWEAELEEAAVESLIYAGGPEQRIVASDGHTVTFLIPVNAKLKIQAAFHFSIHDSIDNDYVSLGGSIEEVTIEHRFEVTLTIDGKGSEEITIEDASVNPATSLRAVDFGHVQPFYEHEPD